MDDQLLRFAEAERRMHWAVAVPFMVCWTTALVLMLVYNPDPSRTLRGVWSWTHRISGLSLLLTPLWVVWRHWHDRSLHGHNIREAWRWTFDDLAWIFLKGPSLVFRSIRLPDQGKFNAGEKINFMILTATWPVYITTGLLLWTHQYAFVAWVVHLSLAAMATPLLFGHIYLAVINPDTRPGLSGMITGLVNRRWAEHHYGHWYRARAGAGSPAVAPGLEPMLDAGPQPAARAAAAGVPVSLAQRADLDEDGLESEGSCPWPHAAHQPTWPPVSRPTSEGSMAGTM